MNTKLRSDVRKKDGDKEHDNDKGCEKLSAAEEQCTVCHRFQAFFKDGLRQVFTAALSKADSNHLWGVQAQVRDVQSGKDKARGGKIKITCTKTHRTYDQALTKHNGHQTKLAKLRSGVVGQMT